MLSRLFTQCPCGSPYGDVTLLTFTHFSGRTLRLCVLGDWTNKHLPTASDIQVTAFSTVRFHAFDLLLFFFKAMVMWSSTSPLVEGRFFFFQNSILKSLMLQLDTKAQSFSLQLPCIYGSAFTAFFMSSTTVIGFIGYCPCVCQCTCTRTLFSPFNPSCDVRAVGDDLLYLISQGGFWWVGVCRLSGGWRFQSCPGYCVCSASTKNSQLGPR